MKGIQVSMLLRSRLVYILLMITVIWCRIFLLRLLTMCQFLHQLKVLSLAYMLLASSYSLVYLISWGQLSMRLIRIHTGVLSAMGLLKSLKLLSVELVFLFCLGVALIDLLIFWTRSQIQQFSKKTKKAPKVEVGTMATDTSMDEWLQGTAYIQSASTKLRKK